MYKHLYLFLLFIGWSVLLYPQENKDSITATQSKPSEGGSFGGRLRSRVNSIYHMADSFSPKKKVLKGYDNLKKEVNDKYKKIDSNLVSRKDSAVSKMKSAIGISKKTTQAKNDSILRVLREEDKHPAVLLSPVSVDEPKLENAGQEEITAAELIKKGMLELKQNKPGEAVTDFEKGLNIAQAIHAGPLIQQAFKGLSDAYALKLDAKRALIYYKLYFEVKDSLYRLRAEKVIVELNSKYEAEKKEREILALQAGKQKDENELEQNHLLIEKQKQVIFLVVVSLIISFVLGSIIFRLYRNRRKISERLLVQNNKVNEQKRELEESLNYTKQLQEALKEDLDHYMQAALRKQMNPHFIFNALNSIQSFILQNDKLSANIYLAKFADLMRKVLTNSESHLIPLEKEIEVLKLYIELEEQRFDNKFNCTWNIDPTINQSTHLVPPLILQPYIENAIWHGLLHKNGERNLMIRISKKDQILICSVEDNGIGRMATMEINKKRSDHKSLGTKITQKRIDLINSLDQSKINIQYVDLFDPNGVASGTKVELSIPAAEAINQD